jgi:hypothetical protein
MPHVFESWPRGVEPSPATAQYIEFAPIHVQQAAASLGLYTVEQFDVIVRCLHVEHVYRVFHVRRVMEAHPPEQHHGVPSAVRDALEALRAIEQFQAEINVPRLDPDEIHARVAAMEKEVLA